MIYIWTKHGSGKKDLTTPPPPKKKKSSKKEKHSKTSINFKFFTCFFVNTFFVFCFLFLFLHLLSCAVFCFSFVFFFLAAFFCFFLFFGFCFLFFTFYFHFFADCFLLFFYFAFIFCFVLLFCFCLCLLFVRFFCWNQSCWFLRTSPILVKINCLDLRCVKHIGLTDKPLSQHDFLRCFVTVVLRNFPRWHRDGLRQRQDRGFLSLKHLGSWSQKHWMEEEIPGLEFEGVHHVQLPFFC